MKAFRVLADVLLVAFILVMVVVGLVACIAVSMGEWALGRYTGLMQRIWTA